MKQYLIVFYFYFLLQCVLFTTELDAQVYDSDEHNNGSVRHRRGLFWNKGLTIKIQDYKTVKLQLKPTSQHLANLFLPIVSAYRRSDPEDRMFFITEYTAMELFGGFTLYQDYETRAAVVHFHKYNILNGIVGMDYIIDNLPFAQVNDVHHVGKSEYVKRRKPSNQAVILDPKFKKKKKFVETLPIEFEASLVKSSNAYPEILVLVSKDLIDKYPPKPTEIFRYQEVLTQIITYFNAMDMLYSKLTQPNIELNLAKIVFEAQESSFTFNQHLVYNSENTIDVIKVLFDMSMYFSKDTVQFRHDSFDQILFLTSRRLAYVPENGGESEYLAGYAFSGDLGDYNMRLSDSESTCINCQLYQYVAALQYLPNYESFPAAAHEFAHLLRVQHDELKDIADASCAFIMQPVDGFATKCLRWSDRSKKEISNIFRTRNQCSMLNFPRSLTNGEPKKIFHKSEQCRCYGFDCASSKCKWDYKDSCKKLMKCWNKKSGKYEEAPKPMDGTPCGDSQVCWGGNCVYTPT